MNAKDCNLMFTSFRVLTKAYNEFVTERVKEYNLSPNEIAVLSALENVSTASVIARDAGVSKALVSRSVKALKAKGLIEVSISEIDKREQDLSLTPEGDRIAGLVLQANEQFCEIATKDTDQQALVVTGLMLQIIINNLNGGGESS